MLSPTVMITTNNIRIIYIDSINGMKHAPHITIVAITINVYYE